MTVTIEEWASIRLINPNDCVVRKSFFSRVRGDAAAKVPNRTACECARPERSIAVNMRSHQVAPVVACGAARIPRGTGKSSSLKETSEAAGLKSNMLKQFVLPCAQTTFLSGKAQIGCVRIIKGKRFRK